MRILEAKIEFNAAGLLARVTVLADFTPEALQNTNTPDVRALFASRQIMGGYMNLIGTKMSETILNDVAETGCETVDRDYIFSGWREKYFGPVSNIKKRTSTGKLKGVIDEISKDPPELKSYKKD